MHNRLSRRLAGSGWLVAVLPGLIAATVRAQFSFQALPQSSSGAAAVQRMDDSAQVIVGSDGPLDSSQVFRWTYASGYSDIGLQQAGWMRSWVGDVTADGGAIVGGALRPDYEVEPFIWTSAGGPARLPTPGGIYGCQATGLTPDGRVIVGSAVSGGHNVMVRWVDGQFENLGYTADHQPSAVGVSNDGSTIATQESWDAHLQAGRWTASGGFQTLGGLISDGTSEASKISGDGKAMVGVAKAGEDIEHAFRWTEDGGMQDLGMLAGDSGWSIASAVSFDGSVIAGTSAWQSNDRAFLWLSSTGMIDLREYLIAHGVADMSSWRLVSVSDMSEDGCTLIGTAQNAAGEQFPFIATIPTPITPVILSAILLRRRGR